MAVLLPQILAVFCLLSSWAIATTCYAPDGTVPLQQSPCFPDAVAAGNATFCCPQGYACLSNQMCMSTSLVQTQYSFYRATCTDPTWKDPSCPNFCSDTGKNAIVQCAAPNASQYCCANNIGNTCDCNTGTGTLRFYNDYSVITTIGYTTSTSSKPSAPSSPSSPPLINIPINTPAATTTSTSNQATTTSPTKNQTSTSPLADSQSTVTPSTGSQSTTSASTSIATSASTSDSASASAPVSDTSTNTTSINTSSAATQHTSADTTIPTKTRTSSSANIIGQPTTTATPSTPSQQKSSPSTVTIAIGASVSCGAVLIVLIVSLIFVYRRKKSQEPQETPEVVPLYEKIDKNDSKHQTWIHPWHEMGRHSQVFSELASNPISSRQSNDINQL